MILFRLSRSKYSTDLSGLGARLAGGRWNTPGVALVYTSESRALCTTEIAVHTGLGLLPDDYQMITLSVPDDVLYTSLDPASLPAGWRFYPYTPATQLLGNQFVADCEFLILKVPSAVVPGDYNFLINPAHPEINRVSIVSVEAFGFDERMFLRP